MEITKEPALGPATNANSSGLPKNGMLLWKLGIESERVDQYCTPTQIDIATCVLNHELLAPVCSRMCLAERKLPTVDDLRDEIVTVLTLGKRQGEDLVVMVEDTAKHIKSLCGLVKLKARRKEVSVATWT